MGTIYSDHGELFLLRACRDTGVIAALLDAPKPPETVAEETGITERAARTTLATLADLGYASESGGEYRATERLQGFDPETPVTERGMLPHRLDILENYLDLPELMRTGEYPEPDAEDLENYVAGMATIDERVVRGAVTAAEHAHPRPERVLDVGGGIGLFAREFARRGASVTLLDNPAVIDLAEPRLEGTGIELRGGDAVASLPEGFDLAFCGRLTVSMSHEENEQLFANLFDALEPGGTVACMEYVRDRSDVGPLFGFHMLTMSPTGNTYTADQYRTWLTDAGFENVSIDPVVGTDFQLVTGHRPEE
jgi:SAM-dependent methyltransferase